MESIKRKVPSHLDTSYANLTHFLTKTNAVCMYDKSGIPLKSWRAVTWNVTNRDLMISAPLIISFFFNHETDDWINCQVQIVPGDGWFGQPKYNIKIFLQQIPLLKECGTQISVLRGIGLLRSICPPCDFNFYQFYLFVFFFFWGGEGCLFWFVFFLLHKSSNKNCSF